MTVGELGIRGMGPFDILLTPEGITGKVEGDVRTLVMSKPARLVRPMYHMDGVRYYAAFPDEADALHATGGQPRFDLALGVTRGKHEIRIEEWAYPELPPLPGRAGAEAGR